MSSEPSTKPSRPPKPSSTRSSLRQSLNFTSVSKALADVINKEPRDSALKKSKDKPKDSSTRRLSLMSSTAIPHASLSQKPKPPTPPHGKEDDPSNKTITTRNSRRHSSLLRHAPIVADELGVKCTDPQPPTPSRRSTLRPRNANGSVTISSALPKYRPKSVIVESTKKPLSPVRAGTRRRFSTSEEDDGDLKDSPKSKGAIRSTEGKGDRPISPLPHRTLAVKVSLPSPTAPSTPTKSKTIRSSPANSGSPARAGSGRPSKTVKTTATSSPSRIPTTRPPSSASSCSSSQPSPLNSASLRNPFGFGRSNSQTPNASRATGRQPPESPLARHSRQTSVISLGGNGKDSPVKPPRLDEGDSEESLEVDDVELLLAPVASLAAPTPAIPRIQTTKYRPNDSELQTPSRPSSFLPTRANLSYLSPLPPTSESSPALRPKGRNNDQTRGSIFSWEQMAAEDSHTLAREELESRLADIPAPFTPGGPSPSVSILGLDVPETPNLSALPSPAGYGSISQILLPDVTPSPAIHHLTTVFETSIEYPPYADGTATLLRLQIAQAENLAKERLSRLQELEDQLHAAKQCRIRETEELANQISFLEQQLHANVVTRERVDEERAAFTASLQDELSQAETRCEQAAKKGFEQGHQAARSSWDAMLANLHKSMEASCAAKEAACLWSSVKDQAIDERNNLRAAREMLNVFLVVLDHSRERVQALRA